MCDEDDDNDDDDDDDDEISILGIRIEQQDYLIILRYWWSPSFCIENNMEELNKNETIRINHCSIPSYWFRSLRFF